MNDHRSLEGALRAALEPLAPRTIEPACAEAGGTYEPFTVRGGLHQAPLDCAPRRWRPRIRVGPTALRRGRTRPSPTRSPRAEVREGHPVARFGDEGALPGEVYFSRRKAAGTRSRRTFGCGDCAPLRERRPVRRINGTPRLDTHSTRPWSRTNSDTRGPASSRSAPPRRSHRARRPACRSCSHIGTPARTPWSRRRCSRFA